MKQILYGQSATKEKVTGKIVLNNRDAIEAGKRGDKVILVKHHTTPDDFEALTGSAGVLTIVGGITSHASIIARELKKGCIINCDDLVIDQNNNQIKIGQQVIPAGTNITLDGNTGNVFLN